MIGINSRTARLFIHHHGYLLLSGADGRVICKNLKAEDETRHIPIIMVSAHPSAGRSIREAGADEFLEKPFEMEALLNKVAKHLALS